MFSKILSISQVMKESVSALNIILFPGFILLCFHAMPKNRVRSGGHVGKICHIELLFEIVTPWEHVSKFSALYHHFYCGFHEREFGLAAILEKIRHLEFSLRLALFFF